MKKVTVRYRGRLASLAGTGEEIMEAADVEGLLKAISERHGREAEKTARTMIIALNGENILLLRHYKTPLKDGDVLSFFPLCAGG